jgi:AraC-like DNA-binding protein
MGFNLPRHPPLTKDSISIALVREALLATPPGIAAQALAQAAVDPAWLDDAQARVSATTYAALWRALAEGLGDEFFNMAPRALPRGGLAFIWRSARGQGTVAAGVATALEGLHLMLGCSARLEQQRSLALITFDEACALARPFACFTFWMIIHGLTCWLAGRRVPILTVELHAPAPTDCDDYRRFFGDNLRFDQPLTRLIFSAECLDLPIRRSEADLQGVCAELPGNLLVKYRDPGGLAQRVRERLQAMPSALWPEAPELAASHGMSVATLRRRLALEGQSLQRVKASVRKARAVAWLAEEGTSIGQVAERLGFADESSFYRAFRQWFGSNPGHYRALIQGTGRNAQAI